MNSRLSCVVLLHVSTIDNNITSGKQLQEVARHMHAPWPAEDADCPRHVRQAFSEDPCNSCDCMAPRIGHCTPMITTSARCVHVTYKISLRDLSNCTSSLQTAGGLTASDSDVMQVISGIKWVHAGGFQVSQCSCAHGDIALMYLCQVCSAVEIETSGFSAKEDANLIDDQKFSICSFM